MPIVSSPLDLIFHDLFMQVRGVAEPARLYLKLEGYNVTGSIKIKPALFMVADLERRGLLRPGESTLVESSSGNLGIALALICSLRGYRFICVTDPNVSPINRRSIEAYGGHVEVVTEKDPQGGYLQSRIARINALVQGNPDHVWLNQYANPFNARAHADWTARAILNDLPGVTRLYVGSGTTGTVMGLAGCFAELSPQTEVVAVEPEGSVTFDQNRKGRRLIPGIGTSRRPELADERLLGRIVYVSERDTVRMCNRLAHRNGLLLGGSSGSVLAAVAIDAESGLLQPGDTVVAIAPDLGDKYLETIYAPEWVAAAYGADTLDTPAATLHPPWWMNRWRLSWPAMPRC